MGSCLGSCVSSESSSLPSSSSSSSTHQTFAAAAAAAAAASSSCLWRRATDEQDAELISHASEHCRHHGLVYRILKFKRKQKCPQFIDKYWDQQQQPSYAKLQNDSALSDIQLQNLDVFKLLNNATPNKETELRGYTRIVNNSSRASSSLDLEWEHEYAQLRQYQQLQQEQQLHQQSHKHAPATVGQQTRYASLDQLTTTATVSAAQLRHVARQARLAGQRHGSFTRTSCCSSTQNSWSHISTPESLEWDIDGEQEQQRQLRLEDDNLDDETLKLLHQIEQLKNHVLEETGDGLSLGVGVNMFAEELSEGLQFRATHFGKGTTELEAHIS